MVFVIINCLLAAFFLIDLIYQDNLEEKRENKIDPFTVNMYLMLITLLFHILVIALGAKMTAQLVSLNLKISFFLEYCMLINISFCLIQSTFSGKRFILNIIKTLLYAISWWIVVKKIDSVSINGSYGIVSGSPELVAFLTWKECFDLFLRFILPCFSAVFLLLSKLHATRLERFLSYEYFYAVLSLWLMIGFLKFMSSFNSGYSLLHYFTYLPLFIIMPLAFRRRSSPSPETVKASVKRALFLYLLPSLVYALSVTVLYFLFGSRFQFFTILLVLLTAAFMFLTDKISKRMNVDSNAKAGFYEKSMEKELAAMDYSLEMTENASRMFSIVHSNMGCSFLETCIANGNDIFSVAFSSKNNQIQGEQRNISEEILGFLIEIDCSAVTYNQIKEDEYKFAASRKPLMEFLEQNKADALILLHEGRALHGFILLGIPESGERFREYDLEVINRLYPYFFVFGYYMRNIANKEILSIINRELKMSSQIITSIQENMDLIKNGKIDTGILMKASYNIGGEFIDMIRLTDTRHLFVVADLSGRGIAASMSMVIFKAMVRSYLEETHDFKQLVVKLNSFVKNNLMKGTICAAMFAILDYKADKFYYINCGIPAIFLYTEAFKNVIEVQGEGHYLGFVDDISPYISVKQISLKNDDVLLVCTKGVVQSHSLRGEQYGKERVQHMIMENRSFPASRMVSFLYDDLIRFMSHEMEYDVSILTLRYKGE